MLDFRMDTFLAVCRHRNYTRAAEELNITQPAVTQHIQYLQSYYGVKLFSYQNKRLALTEEGELLRNAALCMLHDEEKLKRDVKDLRLGRRSIRFGATLTIGEYLLPERLAAYMKRNPRVDVHMLVENTQILLRMINDGELDFAVVEGYFRKSEYDYIIWSQEPYVCVCAAAHPLAQAAPRPLSALFGENLILRNQGSGSRDVLERVLEEQGGDLLGALPALFDDLRAQRKHWAGLARMLSRNSDMRLGLRLSPLDRPDLGEWLERRVDRDRLDLRGEEDLMDIFRILIYISATAMTQAIFEEDSGPARARLCAQLDILRRGTAAPSATKT